MLSLERRLARFVHTWPPRVSREFWRYRKPQIRMWRDGRRAKKTKIDKPYWLLLPGWLADSFRGKRNKSHRLDRFVEDVLWGQYCLFLFMRIQDDLYDGDAKSPALIFISDLFLFEAHKILSQHFPDSSEFWAIYRKSLNTTTTAILHVDVLQQSERSKGKELLKAYAKVNEIFKVGSAAVCIKHGRTRELDRISNFADEISIGSQILDDLTDVAEDLKRGRVNYVANKILRTSSQSGKTRLMREAKVARALLYTSVGTELLAEVGARFHSGYGYLQYLGIAEAKTFSTVYQHSIQAMQTNLNQKRLELLLSPKGK